MYDDAFHPISWFMKLSIIDGEDARRSKTKNLLKIYVFDAIWLRDRRAATHAHTSWLANFHLLFFGGKRNEIYRTSFIYSTRKSRRAFFTCGREIVWFLLCSDFNRRSSFGRKTFHQYLSAVYNVVRAYILTQYCLSLSWSRVKKPPNGYQERKNKRKILP